MFEFLIAVAVVGFLAGMTACVAGFGTGSFLTPLVSIQTGTKIAIALGIFAGNLLLKRIPGSLFKRIVSLLILVLGLILLVIALT